MSIPTRALSLFAVLALGASAAPFANAATIGAPRTARAGSRVAAKAPKTFVYACSPTENLCNVYNTAGTLLRTLDGSSGLVEPAGTMANTKGLWYIANAGGQNVSVYSPGGISLLTTLNDPNEIPGDVAVIKKLTAVSNEYNISDAPGSVSVYKKSATSPSYTLTAPGAVQGIGVTFDAKGDCFWSFNQSASASGRIVEFAGCKPKSKAVDLGISLGNAGGLAFDAGNNLWYTDQTAGLFQCVGTSSCTLVANSFVDPLGINFSKDGTTLYLADTSFGVYAITGFAAERHKAQPEYIVTPFASAPGTYGVAGSPGI